jgi:hypothetical protein
VHGKQNDRKHRHDVIRTRERKSVKAHARRCGKCEERIENSKERDSRTNGSKNNAQRLENLPLI